jgi:hypothetical protein
VALYLGEFNRGLHRGVIDGLENHSIDFLSLGVFEGNGHLHQAIGEALNSNTDWSVLHVRVLGFWYWIIIPIDNSIQILGYSLNNGMKLDIIEGSGL